MREPIKDPFAEREAQRYDNPIPSREAILELMRELGKPQSLRAMISHLQLNDEEQQEGLRRRLRAMERDGQLVFTRQKAYALTERMDLLKGRVQGHPDGFGFVKIEGGDDLYLSHSEMYKAFSGDLVLAQPTRTDKRGRVEGRIVRVLEPRSSQLVGRYFRDDGIGFVVPDDRRIAQDILIPDEARNGARAGQVVVVELTQRPSARFSPVGKISDILGEHMAPGMEIEIALRNHDLPHSWPAEVKTEIAGLSDEVAEADKTGRVDLRHLPLVTIDGEDARDFDDAVYAEAKKSGGWRLWVAIADVSHYVRNGSALDKEAYNRGNSVYFPSQVIPMLPEILSNGLCSLNPEVDRLCMVAEMTVSDKGKLSGFQFYPAVMHSKARLTYTKVQAMLDGDKTLREQYQPVLGPIEELHRLFQALKHARHQRGAIEFETQETKFQFNAERKIEKVLPVHRVTAHMIIEECMILANVAAAKFAQKHKVPVLYRVHDLPDEEKIASFHQFIAELGLRMDGGLEPEPRHFTALLEKLAGRPDAELIQTMLLRSMKQAIYEPDCRGHFGLALSAYAHFTSPIRRYPDLLLHRAIKAVFARQQQAEADGGVLYSEEQMHSMGEHCSMTERRADDATREVSDFLKCEYMQDHVGDVFSGVVSSATTFGLFVRLNDLLIEGLVHVSSLENDYYHFDPVQQALVGERSGKRYRLGDTLMVRVAAVNLESRKIDLMLADSAPKAKKSVRENLKSGKVTSKKGKKSAAEVVSDSFAKKKGKRKSNKQKGHK